MRPLPSPTTTAAAAQYLIIHLSPPLSSPTTSPCDAHTCRWRPYYNSKDFETNTIMILIILFCALICALALNTAIRCFVRSHPPPDRLPQTQQELERKSTLNADAAALAGAPILVYSVGMKLAGTEAECTICLSEFEEGEGIRVLGRCKHGFHVQCIQKWLSSHSSCPTCRCTYLPPSSSSEETTDHCRGNNSQPAVPERVSEAALTLESEV